MEMKQTPGKITETIDKSRRGFLKLTGATAIAATGILSLTGCGTTETVENDRFDLRPGEINIYETILNTGTYEVEIYPYSEGGDPAMEIELGNNFYNTEYYHIDNNYSGESEKIRFTLSNSEKIKIYVKNVGTENSYFSLKINKENIQH